jgi:hypothetical protein
MNGYLFNSKYKLDGDRDARIQTGDGYPHEAVPGEYCCVWATPRQVQKVGLTIQSAQPPLGRCCEIRSVEYGSS